MLENIFWEGNLVEKKDEPPVEYGSPFPEMIDFIRQWEKGVRAFSQKTSGSTGNPKVIQLTRQQMETSAAATLNFLNIGQLHCSFLCLDPRFIAGKMMIVRAWIAGHNLEAVKPSANPFDSYQFKGNHYFTALTPSQLQNIYTNPATISQMEHFECILVGGADVPDSLLLQLKAISPRIYHTYGMTETASHIALKKLNPEPEPYFTILPGIEIDLDQRGCLMIKGAVTRKRWLITNDQVKLIAPDKFIWLGRSDNVINSGGIKLHPETIEKEIGRIFTDLKIERDFYLGGVPDNQFGEKMVLYLEGAQLQYYQEEELKKRMKIDLEKYSVPKTIIYKPVFIRTSNGKLVRSL